MGGRQRGRARTSPTTTPTVSALQRTWPRSDGAGARTTVSRRPLPSLVVFTVSTLGTLGPEAAKLVAALSRRNSGNVPGSFLDAASWACPRLGPFLRQAVGLAARRGLARAVNETYRTVPVAPLLVPAVRVVGSAAAQAYFLAFPALPAAVVP